MAENQQDIEQHAAEAKRQIEALNEPEDEQIIRNTAERLRLMHYDPGLDVSGEDFLSFRKQDAVQEIDRIASLPLDVSEREVRLSYFATQYELLCRLRNEETEAWDEIEELYGED